MSGKDVTVESIQREILFNGAVQTSWNPPAYMITYSKGMLDPSNFKDANFA